MSVPPGAILSWCTIRLILVIVTVGFLACTRSWAWRGAGAIPTPCADSGFPEVSSCSSCVLWPGGMVRTTGSCTVHCSAARAKAGDWPMDVWNQGRMSLLSISTMAPVATIPVPAPTATRVFLPKYPAADFNHLFLFLAVAADLPLDDALPGLRPGAACAFLLVFRFMALLRAKFSNTCARTTWHEAGMGLFAGLRV